mgnify:CR=1 FL=1
MNSTELVIKTIQESSYTIQQWADELGVHRNQIHRWLSGSVDKIRKDNIFAVGKVINKKPKFSESGVEWVELDNEQLETKEQNVSVNAERIIDHQQTTIELLKEKIARLEKKLKSSDGFLGAGKHKPDCVCDDCMKKAARS